MSKKDSKDVNDGSNDDARLKAANDFIELELKMDPNCIRIVSTKKSPKSSNILWINCAYEEDVLYLYARIAQLKLNSIRLIMFPARKFYARP